MTHVSCDVKQTFIARSARGNISVIATSKSVTRIFPLIRHYPEGKMNEKFLVFVRVRPLLAREEKVIR